MRSSLIVSMLAVSSVISACQPGDVPIAGTITPVSPGALSSFFIDDWAPYETAAANLRASAQYTIQNFYWTFGGPASVSNNVHDSLDFANVEYAHAAGLTGAGQTISIVDSGFLTSHDEFVGKSITLTSGPYTPGVDDHGTAVAAIAAGSASNGLTIGVAPGAALHLGSANLGFDGITAATLQAAAAGAIVQNNSWGWTLDVSQQNFQSFFGGTSGTNYINSLKTFANNGVIVFAESNDNSRTTSQIMAALPQVVPELETSWITAVNAVPQMSGSTINSGALVSSACWQAAAWCMAADGTMVVADSANNSAYAYGYGSSFAAPQIAGTIALLAQAFPSLTAQDLRARVLASANNSFYDHTGYVQFGTIKHGYNSQLGHGFLDVQAALSPIGGSFMPLSAGGSVSLNSPRILSGGMAGNAISAGLSQYSLAFVDGLGANFDAPANILSANAVPSQNANANLVDLLSVNLDLADTDPFNVQSDFAEFVPGQELDIPLASGELTLLLPETGGEASYGMSLSQRFEFEHSNLKLGISAMHEADGVVGIKSLVPGAAMQSTHSAATFDWNVPLNGNQEISLSGSLGIAIPTGSSAAASMSSVQYNSLNISYGARGILGAGDRFSIGLGLPQAVQSGTAQFALPVSAANGSTQFGNVAVPLAPDGRQIDLSISYGMPMSRNSEVVMSATHSLNAGNFAGERATSTAIGWKYQF